MTINEIIDSIRIDDNDYWRYSHFSAGNMKDYTLMTSTINDLSAFYGIDQVEAGEIVLALTH